MSFPLTRPRRNRRSSAIRDLIRETELTTKDLVWPVFLLDGSSKEVAIGSMPGCFRWSVDHALRAIEDKMKQGLRAVALFPCIEASLKNSKASEVMNTKGLVPRAIREIKKNFPELVVFGDIALDPYSSDGHDGLIDGGGRVLNDETIEVLIQQAYVQADAGVDFIAPSDMMDGRVLRLREALDEKNFLDVGILSYTAKYASAFYGPFRDALDSAPKFGDKKTYQMDYANKREALLELEQDLLEGADMVMVKPALSYLDIIGDFADHSNRPIAAYNVSGEYAMVKASSQRNWIDERKVVLEILTSMKRAGANMIFSYHTPDVLNWLE